MSRIVISFDTRSQFAGRVPVPVEVYDENLTPVADRIVHLSEGGRVEVPKAGLYHVRAALPSGEGLSATVRVPSETADVPLLLEARERSPYETLAWAYASQSVRQASGVSPRLGRDWSLPSPETDVIGLYRMTTSDLEVLRPGGPNAWTLTPFTDGKIDKDDSSIANQDGRLVRWMHVERNIPYDRMDLWSPIYLCCRLQPARNMPKSDCLFAIPPSKTADILFVRADLDPLAGTRVRALVQVNHPSAEALLAYMGHGAVKAARRIAPEVVDLAVTLLREKREDPVSAVIAGYFLLRVGRLEHHAWMENLANWFTTLPDGAIIYGASLLRGEGAPGQRLTARHYLLEAVRRGIPAYTVGLRLLFDGLRRLTVGVEQDDVLRAALAKVRAAAAHADWEAATTSLTVPTSSKSLPFVL